MIIGFFCQCLHIFRHFPTNQPIPQPSHGPYIIAHCGLQVFKMSLFISFILLFLFLWLHHQDWPHIELADSFLEGSGLRLHPSSKVSILCGVLFYFLISVCFLCNLCLFPNTLYFLKYYPCTLFFFFFEKLPSSNLWICLKWQTSRLSLGYGGMSLLPWLPRTLSQEFHLSWGAWDQHRQDSEKNSFSKNR